MSHAYYNEIDKNAAAWIRELITRGDIAPGEVDERSIEDVTPDDLRGYTQCHFFAGIGIWSHALRLAGWPDDKPIWTGSCPCQPFSAAGKGAGVDDERHLWPAFHWLIKQCRPSVVLGEQVAHKAGAAWFDIVSTDLEGENYSSGKIVFGACGVGAPHLRVRQYWVGHTSSKGLPERISGEISQHREVERLERSSPPRGVGHALRSGARGNDGRKSPGARDDVDRDEMVKSGRVKNELKQQSSSPPCELADSESERRGETGASRLRQEKRAGERGDSCELAHAGREGSPEQCGGREQPPVSAEAGSNGDANPTNGHWRDADWLLCRDDKWRPVKPGSFPLADGAPSELVPSGDLRESDAESTKEARVMRLKGYGNGIVATQAQAFIEVVQEILTGDKSE